METFYLEQTAKTPFVQFDPNSGKFEMKGKSIPENSKVFYTSMFEWLDKYTLIAHATSRLDIQLNYFKNR
jgi:hypothetical protein